MSEKFNFADAYKKIEGINEWFQEENIDLDEAIEKYKEGMELIEKCKERLKETETKFKNIKSKYSVENGVEDDEDDKEEENVKDIPF